MKRNNLISRFVAGVIGVALAITFHTSVVSQDTIEKNQDEKQDVKPSVRELMQKAQQQIANGDLKDAVKTYELILEEEPGNSGAWHMKGYALHMVGDLDAAIVAHKKAAESDDQRIKNLGNYNLACAYSLQRNNDEAIKHLEMVVENEYQNYDQMRNDPDFNNIATDYRFAKILSQVNNDKDSANEIEKAEAKVQSQEFAAAAEIYHALFEKDDDNPFVTYRLGYCLHGAGELDKALEYHRKATSFPAVAAIATYNIGRIHSLNEEMDEAFEAFQKAVKMGFDRTEAFEEDPDLNNIREDSRFAKLLDQVREKAESNSKKGS